MALSLEAPLSTPSSFTKKDIPPIVCPSSTAPPLVFCIRIIGAPTLLFAPPPCKCNKSNGAVVDIPIFPLLAMRRTSAEEEPPFLVLNTKSPR